MSTSTITIPSGSADDDLHQRGKEDVDRSIDAGESSECPICYETFRRSSGPSTVDDNVAPVSLLPVMMLSEEATCHPQECIRIPNCDHEFCRACLRRHCQHSISIRKIPIECPAKASDKCESTVPISHIQAVLLQQEIDEPSREASSDRQVSAGGEVASVGLDLGSDEAANSVTRCTTSPSLYNRYGSLDESSDTIKGPISHLTTPVDECQKDWLAFERLHRLFLNKNLTPCTRCQEPVAMISPSTSTQTDDLERHSSRSQILRRKASFDPITCIECGHSFCQVHGDAHPDMTCEEYIQKLRRPDEQIRRSERVIRQHCKPCSHCQAPIYKASGCDHIICPSCHDDMCFKCGTHRYLVGQSMVRSCKKCDQSFIDHRHIGRYRMIVCLALPLYLPLYLLHVVLVGALALLSCGCCCCLGCGIQRKTRDNGKAEQLKNANERKASMDEEYVFRPMLGMHTVLGIIFLPFIDLFHQCGISCCCGIMKSERRSDFEVNNDVDDDEELQLQPTLTMSTTPSTGSSSSRE